jgi:hypothetical protein
VFIDNSGIVRLAMNSITYDGPYFTSIGTVYLVFPNFAVFLVANTTLNSIDELGITFYTLSGSILIPAILRIFLSKLNVTGILPTLVSLNDFFLVAPTTTFPKSH